MNRSLLALKDQRDSAEDPILHVLTWMGIFVSKFLHGTSSGTVDLVAAVVNELSLSFIAHIMSHLLLVKLMS